MTCVEFWIWIATGIAIVPALDLLKKLPGAAGAFIQKWAPFIAMLLSITAPLVGELMQPMCAKIDPLLWGLIYAALAYLASQITYWLSKKVGLSV